MIPLVVVCRSLVVLVLVVVLILVELAIPVVVQLYCATASVI
jgi:hypothetical protein